MKDIPISIYRNAKDNEGATTTLGVFLTSAKHAKLVEEIRSAERKEYRDALKKNLPAATISGTFSRREISGLKMYNGLVCMDFDGKDNPSYTAAQMKDILRQIQEVAYAGISVGGAGVFAIVPTNNQNPQKHPIVVNLLGRIFERIGLVFDKSCKDVCRLRFVSYDPEAYWNESPATFNAERYLQAIEEESQDRRPRPISIRDKPVNTDRTAEKVEQYVQAIEGSCVDITGDYEDWYRLAFAFASEFGAAGEDYFLRISQYNPKYDQAEATKKFANALRTGRRVSIGTFFKICQNNGIQL